MPKELERSTQRLKRIMDKSARDLSNVRAGLSKTKITADEIEASNILAGSLTAGIIVTTGSLSAGGTTIDDDGIRLNEISDLELTYPSDDEGVDWFTGPKTGNDPTPYAGMTFVNQSDVDFRRGVLLSADGNNINKRGTIMMRATDGDQNIAATGTTYIEIESNVPGVGGLGGVNFKGYVTAHNHMDVFGNLYCEGDVDFTFAPSIDFGGTRLEGGYITGNLNENSSWWGYDSGGLPTIQIRRIANFCVMSGRIQNNRTSTNNTDGHPIGTVPADFRPTTNKVFVIPRQGQTTTNVYDSQCRVILEGTGSGTPGQLHLGATAANEVQGLQDISFDGVAYTID
jgi:hypothetical protein